MSIWYYKEHLHLSGEEADMQGTCMFCRSALTRDEQDELKAKADDRERWEFTRYHLESWATVGICPACGWWKYCVTTVVGQKWPSHAVRVARLKELDIGNISIPLTEVRSYITARYQERFDIHPRVFEEIVASVFRDHGYVSRATAYSGDGGIDVILQKDTVTVGVQVKRQKRRISVSQIRELTGALVLGGYTKGVFVTTSTFQSGAHAVARRSADRGYPIELIDAPAFLEALKIAQLQRPEEVMELKPWEAVGRGA